MTSTFPHLLSPLKAGTHLLRNRVVMGSMHTRLEHLDDPVRREAAFYAARAAGGAALLVTGGFSPNEEGRLEPGAPILADEEQARHLSPLVEAVHAHGALFLLQILHAGRYAKHPQLVGPSDIKSPINPLTPRAMQGDEVARTVSDYVRCAHLARLAGFDGVELMGSEGYLINQFTAPRTNNRTDVWGGSAENRRRFSVEVTRRIREELGPDFLIMYRISAIDLVDGGASAEETDALAHAVQQAGADILNTGYGWHEAPVPTIAYQVPRGAWAFGASRLKEVVSIPVMASNRINTPELAERLIATGDADLISMARPLLADPEFVVKAAQGRADEINTCIACNQACLDHIFTNRTASCLVNPRAGREVEFSASPAARSRRIAVVGSGPGGLAAAVEAGRRGHRVTLFEAEDSLGGQLNLARRVPGKQEFDELLRYFHRQLALSNVEVVMGRRADPAVLKLGGFDHVVVATGTVPRRPEIEGIDSTKVVSYIDVLTGRVKVGARAAVIGTGGIGHDIAEFLSDGDRRAGTVEDFYEEWGVDTAMTDPGGAKAPARHHSAREITLFQRSPGRVGDRLGKSTGWIVRNRLRARGVRSVAGATYTGIDERGLHYRLDGQQHVAEVEHVVVCAGQESESLLALQLRQHGIAHDLIGGARLAGELDAVRAIDEGTRLAQTL